MKIYFLSSQSCALTLNDLYFGITDCFERFAEINLRDRIFARFTPQGALPIGFFITEELPFSPPEGCEIYLLKDGIAVYARDFQPANFSLKVHAQAREKDCLVTVFSQGATQVSIETKENFFISTLPHSFCDCEIIFQDNFIFIKSQNELTVYATNGKRLFLERVTAFTLRENGFNATLPLSDALSRVAECSWNFYGEDLQRESFVIKQPSNDKTPTQIRKELLPYVFFESVLIGADFSEFLSEDLKEKQDNLRAFLGEFVSVILTEDYKTCGLVKKKAERLYEVAYFSVEIENEKIIDVKG